MRIIGFGTCMISGYPNDLQISFFEQFINQIRLDHNNIDFTKVISLGGFPVDRAKKYLNNKVLSLNPDLVILQFGTTDVTINLTAALAKILNSTKISSNSSITPERLKQPLKYNFFTSLFKYLFKNLLIKIFKIKPVTPIDIYISSIEEMISTLNKNSVKVILMAPFIQLDPFANIRINKYIKKIKGLCENYNFCLVNCNGELKKHKKTDIFLVDGFHLSPKGHLIVATQLKKVFLNESLN